VNVWIGEHSQVMKYDNTKLRQMLAAEYVLGTLRGRARRRFERLADRDAGILAEVRFWESRLAALAAGLPPEMPPAAVWLRLEHEVGLLRPTSVTPIRRPATDSVAMPPSAPRPPRPATVTRPDKAANDAPAPLWRIFAGLATAAAVVLAVLIGTRVPLPGDAPTQVAVAPSPPAPVVPAPTPAAPAAVYVSLLKLPDSNMQWTLAVSSAAGSGKAELKAVASGEYPALGEHSLELWVITDAGPVSVGVLPTSGSGTMPMPVGVSGEQLTLAVSLEPVGGSPTGKPTGPVLTSGPAIKAV